MKKYFLISILFLFQMSCVTEQKARSRAIEFYREHPAELAQTCADKFPIGTEYIKGFSIIKKDTTINRAIYINCPEGINPLTKNAYTPQVKCPEVQTIYIESVRVDTIKTENKARVEQFRLETEEVEKKNSGLEAQIKGLEAQLNKSEIDLKSLQKESDKRLYIIIFLCAIIVLCVFLIFKK